MIYVFDKKFCWNVSLFLQLWVAPIIWYSYCLIKSATTPEQYGAATVYSCVLVGLFSVSTFFHIVAARGKDRCVHVILLSREKKYKAAFLYYTYSKYWCTQNIKWDLESWQEEEEKAKRNAYFIVLAPYELCKIKCRLIYYVINTRCVNQYEMNYEFFSQVYKPLIFYNLKCCLKNICYRGENLTSSASIAIMFLSHQNNLFWHAPQIFWCIESKEYWIVSASRYVVVHMIANEICDKPYV